MSAGTSISIHPLIRTATSVSHFIIKLTDCVQTSTRRSPNAGLMLGHRRRRWPNINPALGQRLVLGGI